MTAAGMDADDLAMLGAGFEAALRDARTPGAAIGALFDLGWGEVLAAAPAQAVATACTAVGTTGSPAAVVDDVCTHALGLEPSPQTAVLLPAPGSPSTPGRRNGDRIVVDASASSRIDDAEVVLLAVDSGDRVEVVRVDPAGLVAAAPEGLDPGRVYRRVRTELDAHRVAPAEGSGAWADAVAAGRVALAFELVATSRVMLELARVHAIDREQFGRPVASFQAVRHRLAEALVQIEGAAGVADAATGGDPLTAAVAKSLAGHAALTTAGHAQQVLAGIGFTTDHPFHLRLKRALVLDAVLGSARSLPAEIGAEILRRGHAPRLVELG